MTVLVKNVPKQLSQWLLQILPTVWNTLTISAHVYVATVVNETEDVEQKVELDVNYAFRAYIAFMLHTIIMVYR